MQRRSRSSSRSRSRDSSSSSEVDGVRVYVGELSPNCSERELEHIFKKYGPLVEVWMARVPPCFAFVVFRDREDADEAVRAMNGRTICGRRVRVSIARPRVEARGPRQQRVSQTNDVQCFKCGDRGHLSRNCYMNRGYRNQSPRRRRRSPSYERSRSRSRSRRSRSHDRSRKEETSRDRNSEEESPKRSSSKRHKDKNRDKDSVTDSQKERRRSESTKGDDQESNNAGASSSAMEATVDNDGDVEAG